MPISRFSPHFPFGIGSTQTARRNVRPIGERLITKIRDSPLNVVARWLSNTAFAILSAVPFKIPTSLIRKNFAESCAPKIPPASARDIKIWKESEQLDIIREQPFRINMLNATLNFLLR